MSDRFFNSEGIIFKSSDTEDGGLATFVLDKETKNWRPVSVGAFTEAEMYGKEIESPYGNSRSRVA